MKLRFFDLETRGTVDLKKPVQGPYGLAAHIEGLTDLTLVTWQDVDLAELTEGPVMAWQPLTEPTPEFAPVSFWVAFNARYDRLAWNWLRHKYGLPALEVDKVLDLAVRTRASGLGESLAEAAKDAGLATKLDKGPMMLIYDASKPLPTDPKIWADFVAYGRRDTELLWPLWKRTHSVRAEDWAQWVVSEEINDKGIPLDLDLTRRLQEAAKIEDEANKRDLEALCGLAPSKSVALGRWVLERLPEEVLPFVQRTVSGMSLNARTALPQLMAQELPEEVREVLELLEGAKSPATSKADAIARTAVRGRAFGSYIFNGASTGRFASRGVQMHNLARPIKGVDLVPALLAGEPLQATVRLSRALAATLRGCVMAGEGKTLVWGDWSAIEARVLPWLAYDPEGPRTAGRHAQRVLDRFFAGQDVYVEEARGIFEIDEVSEDQRQAGKVAVLALGFGGWVNAYQRMARNYGVKMPDEAVAVIAGAWRMKNPWAPWFWDALEVAMSSAWKLGGKHRAGRVTFYRAGGDVLCRLPSGRSLVYRGLCRDIETDEYGNKRTVWNYHRNGSWTKVYGGLLAENVTQATAADLLRAALVRARHLPIVAHTHDEIVLESPAEVAQAHYDELVALMIEAPPWAEGLPLAASGKIAKRYGK